MNIDEPEMITRADADLAVVLMVEKAEGAAKGIAESCARNVTVYSPPMAGAHDELRLLHTGGEQACWQVVAAIRALAPASALAELQALRDERDGLLRAAHDNHEADKRAAAAEAQVAHLDAHIEAVAKGTHEMMISAGGELVTLKAQVERLTGALKAANDYLDKGLPERAFNVTRAAITEGAAP